MKTVLMVWNMAPAKRMKIDGIRSFDASTFPIIVPTETQTVKGSKRMPASNAESLLTAWNRWGIWTIAIVKVAPVKKAILSNLLAPCAIHPSPYLRQCTHENAMCHELPREHRFLRSLLAAKEVFPKDEADTKQAREN